MFDHASNSLSMLDREKGVALFWTRTARDLPSHARGAPFRTIFGWWLESHERVLVHAGAVAKQNRAVLLIGPGGSGKSTVALLCLKAGWQYLADDYCIIDLSETNLSPRVFSLYQTAKISRDWWPRLRILDASNSEPFDDKQLFFLGENFPDRIDSSASCRGCLLPVVANRGDTRIVPATKGEAVRALAPSSIFQNAVAPNPAFRRIGEFISQVPVANLELGESLDEIAPQMDDYLCTLP